MLATLLLVAGSGTAQHDDDGGKVSGAEVSKHTHADVELDKKDTEDNNTGVGNKGDIKQKIEKNDTRKEKNKENLEERLKNKLQLKEENGTGENENNAHENKANQKQKIKERIKEKIKQARSATDNAKQKYKEAKEMYSKAKQGDKAAAHIHARTMMQTGINYIDAWLERIELQTLDSDLDNETKWAILEKIDDYRNDTRKEMEKINNTSNLSKMRETARELNYQWKDIRLFIKATGYRIAAGELKNIVEKTENLEPKIEKMRANANNTTRFDLFVSNYHHNLEMAEENLDEAENVLANATTVQEVMKGHKMVFKATNNLKQVFKDIRLMKNEFLA